MVPKIDPELSALRLRTINPELRKRTYSGGDLDDTGRRQSMMMLLESELVWRTVFQTRSQAERAIARYIDGFYNPIRRHSALDFISPIQFERRAAI